MPRFCNVRTGFRHIPNSKAGGVNNYSYNAGELVLYAFDISFTHVMLLWLLQLTSYDNHPTPVAFTCSSNSLVGCNLDPPKKCPTKRKLSVVGCCACCACCCCCWCRGGGGDGGCGCWYTRPAQTNIPLLSYGGYDVWSPMACASVRARISIWTVWGNPSTTSWMRRPVVRWSMSGQRAMGCHG